MAGTSAKHMCWGGADLPRRADGLQRVSGTRGDADLHEEGATVW